MTFTEKQTRFSQKPVAAFHSSRCQLIFFLLVKTYGKVSSWEWFFETQISLAESAKNCISVWFALITRLEFFKTAVWIYYIMISIKKIYCLRAYFSDNFGIRFFHRKLQGPKEPDPDKISNFSGERNLLFSKTTSSFRSSGYQSTFFHSKGVTCLSNSAFSSLRWNLDGTN